MPIAKPRRPEFFRWAFGLIAVAASTIQSASAQEPIAAPVAPLRLSLQELINLGLEKQPALTAARASLAAAESGRAGVNSLPKFAALVSRDIPVRRQQASLGVTIAAAGLAQAEWETRYAVVRNYFSVIYARQQLALISEIRRSATEAIEQSNKLLKGGDAELKITTIDRDVLILNLELLKTKETEATIGVKKAIAALREALGVGLDYPLDVVEAKLPEAVEIFGSEQKDELIAAALANRGEMAQANAANQVTCLEITAQSRLFFKPSTKTFAAGADIHAKPIPQGVANGEYRPGAIGPEMPVFFVGKRHTRIQRAEDLYVRSNAVVDKTQNLIALEVEATFLKLQEAQEKAVVLANALKLSKDVSKRVRERFNIGKVTAGDLLQGQTIESTIDAQINEAKYNYALALAALERVTAGGYRLTAEPR